MLLSQQPHGCINSISSLPTQAVTHYDPTKLFKSILTPPTATICIQVSFTSNTDMAPVQTDPFDLEPSSPSPTPLGQPPRAFSGKYVDPPGHRTFRRANAERQAELKYGSVRWTTKIQHKDRPTIPNNSSKSDAIHQPPKSASPRGEIDVFEVQRQTDPAPSFQQPEEDLFAKQIEALGLSSTNNNPPLSHSTPPSTLAQAVNIGNPKHSHSPLQSPIQSPRRDPRHLFGSEGTHLPWIRKLSPNQFEQNVKPDMLPRGSPPPKSIWEAEDDEFDRWPTPMEAREELDSVRRNATLKRSTFVKHKEPELSVAERIAEALETPMGEADATADEKQQTVLELEDMECGNPWGRDLHDTFIAPFRSRNYSVLPAKAPVRHMHVLDAVSYTTSQDPIVKIARPRLCDAVATVLAYTSPECLEAFLNPEVEVFEWRRLGNCVMIRREGREVIVGNYYNFGTMYQWGFLVRSVIDIDGAWTETYASVSQGTTPVTKERVLFDEFEADSTEGGVEPDNEEFALYVGRQLAGFLLRWEVWNYNKWWRYKVEWEADGKLTNAREKNRHPAGLTFD